VKVLELLVNVAEDVTLGLVWSSASVKVLELLVAEGVKLGLWSSASVKVLELLVNVAEDAEPEFVPLSDPLLETNRTMREEITDNESMLVMGGPV
jgi:hypothetical protein